MLYNSTLSFVIRSISQIFKVVNIYIYIVKLNLCVQNNRLVYMLIIQVLSDLYLVFSVNDKSLLSRSISQSHFVTSDFLVCCIERVLVHQTEVI